MKLLEQATVLRDKEVLEYKKALDQLASIIAKREIKPDVITSSHIIDARRRLWKKPTKFSFYDSVFAVGCACLGVTIKSILEIYNKISTLNSSVIILALLCGLLLGIGVIGKAKQN